MSAAGLALGADGWCEQVARIASPNFDARPTDAPIDLLVVHNISLPPGEFGGSHIKDLFTNALDCDSHPYFDRLRGLRVSSHFLIRRDGAIEQFVSVLERAWHAGASSFEGREGCNDFSVGVELEGTDFSGFETIQYESLAQLTRVLMQRLPLRAVAGHEHIAPGRKTDPGPCFSWDRYCLLLRGALQQDSAARVPMLQFP
jgi:N-acetyl-anhydromuramoyl-L-alanine amidase